MGGVGRVFTMLAYAIKSAIYLSMMYIPYMLMLRNESFFRFNRLLLLCIMLLSLILPFCDFHSLAVEGNPLHRGMIEIGMPMAIVEGQAPAPHNVSVGINWQLVIAYIYIIGVIVTALVKLYQLSMLYFTIRRGVLWKDEKEGVTIYCHANNIVPFSWFSTIVISEQDYRLNAKEIIGHEMGHIRHHHSWDICLVNIVEVIQWMNPLAWILASSLRNVHEYEADDAVLRSGVNARQYQTLLIRKAVGASSYSFANSFNHSQLKKRFTMMFRKESNPWMRTKGLYIIPVAVIALSAFATPELNNRVDAITEKTPSVIASKGNANSAPVQENLQKIDAPLVEQESVTEENDTTGMQKVFYGTVEYSQDADANLKSKDDEEEKAFDVVEHMPEYPGGMKELMQYLMANVRYPKIAFENGVAARVLVQFIVEKDGSISNVKTVNFKKLEDNKPASENNSSEEFVQAVKADSDEARLAKEITSALTTEAQRVVASMPKWIPGTQSGKAVRVKYVIPITFRLS